MTSTDCIPHDDPLLELQLRVARRADELARVRFVPTDLNLHCWLQAEEEILGSDPPPCAEALAAASVPCTAA